MKTTRPHLDSDGRPVPHAAVHLPEGALANEGPQLHVLVGVPLAVIDARSPPAAAIAQALVPVQRLRQGHLLQLQTIQKMVGS
jgi:hypothetical protein